MSPDESTIFGSDVATEASKEQCELGIRNDLALDLINHWKVHKLLLYVWTVLVLMFTAGTIAKVQTCTESIL